MILYRTDGVKPSRWLMSLARFARVQVLVASLMGVFLGGLIILQAWLLADIINAVFIQKAPVRTLSSLLLFLLLVFGLRALCSYAKDVWGFKASRAVRERVRHDVLRHVAKVGPVRLRALKTGGVVSAIIEQVEALGSFFSDYLPQMTLVVVIPLLIAGFVFPLNWLSGVMLLLTAPMIPFFMALVGMGAESLNQKHFQSLSRMSGHFLDVLQGLTTLKLFNRSRDQVHKIEKISHDFKAKTMAVLRIAFISSAVLELFSSISIALLAVYLGMSLLGNIHLGNYGHPMQFRDAFFILLLAPEFYLPLRQLAKFYHARAEAIGASEELMKVFALPPIKEELAGLDFHAGQVKVEWDSVSFAYPESRPVLTELSLQVAPGSCLTITGPSGAGKTTLLQLMMGFLMPSQGEIRVNDGALSALNLDTWRTHVGWLGQNPRLIPGTIRDNIALAEPGADLGTIIQVAERAEVMAFASELPKGLDTRVGEKNWGLSGGQAQRIALARVLLKNAPVLLLDEPLMSLDEACAQRIAAVLAEFMKDKTTILATHQPLVFSDPAQTATLCEGRLITAQPKAVEVR